MNNDFLSRIVSAISKIVNQAEIFQDPDRLKITCECVYCGRSNRGVSHLGILILQHDKDKITGGVNCFRCGTSKTLKSFLYDLKEPLSIYGISLLDISKNVTVKKNAEKIVQLDFKSISNSLFIEQNAFYDYLRKKYKDDQYELKRKIFFAMNGFMFLKNRLKLKFKPTIYEAYRILRDVKARGYLNKNNKVVLLFDNKIRYIFDTVEPEQIEFCDERDVDLFGKTHFPFVSKSYTKLKNPPSGDSRYYIVKDTNCGEAEKYSIMNVYVAEGVFDTLTMKYYKNLFNLDQVNRIQENIINLYVAMAHSKIDKFITEYIIGIKRGLNKLPVGVKELNFIMIPDLNMNVRKYIFSLYNFVKKCYTDIQLNCEANIKIFYLDLFDFVGNHEAEGIKDINDVIFKFSKKSLRNIKLVEVL